MIDKGRRRSTLYVIIILVAIVFAVYYQESEFRTSSFCAYGTVFVEFEEGNRKWGTILLDRSGKPIPCSDSERTPVVDNFKEVI